MTSVHSRVIANSNKNKQTTASFTVYLKVLIICLATWNSYLEGCLTNNVLATQDKGNRIFWVFLLVGKTNRKTEIANLLQILNLKCMFIKTPIHQGSISKNSWSVTAVDGQWFIICIVVVQDLHKNVM